MCSKKTELPQQDRDQSDEGAAADDAFLWHLGAASQKNTFETAPISVWKVSSGVAWYYSEMLCHPKIGGVNHWNCCAIRWNFGKKIHGNCRVSLS